MTVVETVVTTLEHLIADRGRARIAFPGGRSAVGLMQELATKPPPRMVRNRCHFGG